MSEQVDTADLVDHAPTGETWTVAYVRDGRIAWVGWPEGEAALSDCTLRLKATPDQLAKVLRMMADSPGDRPRQLYARHRLEQEELAREKLAQVDRLISASSSATDKDGEG